MVLIIDITKGIQTQTSEVLSFVILKGIIIGGITSKNFLIVLNKVDLIPSDERSKFIENTKLRLKESLSDTAFANAEMVSFSTVEDTQLCL